MLIARAANTISVYNSGKGIPVVMHAKEQVYVPELIFGHLLTSSNYDDAEKKVCDPCGLSRAGDGRPQRLWRKALQHFQH